MKSGGTAFTILILAFGIGARIAIFSVVDGVLRRQPPYRDPDRLVWLWSVRSDGTRSALAMQDVVDLQERSTAFDTLAAMEQWRSDSPASFRLIRQRGTTPTARHHPALPPLI